MLSRMSRHALTLIGISKCYHAGVQGCSASVRALSGVSLRVRGGEVLGITGASGAGKSTLLLCAAGLLRPDAGSVLWFGTPHGDRALSGGRAPAYVPSHPVYYPFLTVREVLEDCGASAGATARERRSLVQWAARAAALEEHLHERVGAGPPSRSRQLALALALAARPGLLLLDDTLTELGTRAFASIARTLGAVSARGMAIVITARRAEVLRGVATRWMTLADGTLREVPLPPAPAFGAIEMLPHRAPPARVAEGAAP
jgi:ABC-type multidrug transport system ATPase subunit